MSGSSEVSVCLDSGITSLPGVGEKRADLLAQLNIATVRDLLFHFPRGYQDRRSPVPLGEVGDGDVVTVCAEVVKSRIVRLRRGLSLAEVSLRDASGSLKAIWFGQPYLAQAFKAGASGFFSGQAGKWNGLALRNPEYELLAGDDDDRLNSGCIVPVYRLTEGVSQRMIRRLVRTALDHLAEPIADSLPRQLRATYDYPPADSGLRTIHFPGDMDAAKAARNRFAYEELLGIQLGVLLARQTRHHESKAYRHAVDGERLRALRASLPFALTGAQQRAVADILDDMASDRPMVRLLQGDVGCGKTAVALHAIAAAADGGFQTALMAPTEILAEQHALTLREALAPLRIEVVSLTGSTAGSRAVVEALASGACHVVAGTHALIQDRVSFHRLGLVIIDEQHRFGVVQRAALLEKGLTPDMLHMTATPIPRTLAVTVYGGMDVTVIDELPPNRAPIKTARVPPAKVPGLYSYICEQAAQGRQTYIICPLVEESLSRELTAVTTHFEQLAEGPLKGLRLGLLHGRLTSSEKDDVMHRFKRGDLDALVSTTVIEVGIDCPNATTIVIEDAAQFGLPQLHQLRGRVGRGSVASRCFLLGKPRTPEGRQRLEILCGTQSGFDIAEADLEMRGPGEFRGVRQAGLSDLRVADLIRDVRILDAARRDAQALLDADPALASPDHAALATAARAFASLSA